MAVLFSLNFALEVEIFYEFVQISQFGRKVQHISFFATNARINNIFVHSWRFPFLENTTWGTNSRYKRICNSFYPEGFQLPDKLYQGRNNFLKTATASLM